MSEAGEAAPRTPHDAGTTLIEALVVVAITTLTALIVFPQTQRVLLTLARRQTAAVMAARMREAHAHAVQFDQPVAFAVARDGRSYASTGTGLIAAPPGVTLAAASGGDGVDARALRENGAPIAFYGDGSSTGGVVLVRSAHAVTTIVVSPTTGAIAMRSP